ncbi:hypothetical protein EMIT0P253_40314 [Pseudomonas sp. IT-P253]
MSFNIETTDTTPSRASLAPTGGGRVLAADSGLKPKLKSNPSLQYSGGNKQPYSRVATIHCVQSQCFLRDTCQ